ncbi:MAG: hypothetical protein OEY14_13075 [Myxococcales bacterium]|nr:hypothetical protein [Myxococcales bacterium]
MIVFNHRGSVPRPGARSGTGFFATTLALCVLAGCIGNAEDISAHRASLRIDGDAETIPRSEWGQAPAGCEGKLVGAFQVRRAEGAPELLVALDPSDGSTLCVDTRPALELELRGRGLSDESPSSTPYDEDEGQRWLSSVAEGDPSPQPNRPLARLEVMGDPSPQPNRPTGTFRLGRPQPDEPRPTEGDPSPQPNDEGDPKGSASDTGLEPTSPGVPVPPIEAT